MLPKAHLTSPSRMSGSRWVITPSWLSESLRPYLYCFSVYSCHFLISSAPVKSIQFISFIVPIFEWNVPLVVLIFLMWSLVFLALFFSISFHCSLNKTFLSFLALVWNSGIRSVYLSLSPLSFASLLFSTICKVSSDNHFAFLHIFFLGMVLITASCPMYKPHLYFFRHSACRI